MTRLHVESSGKATDLDMSGLSRAIPLLQQGRYSDAETIAHEALRSRPDDNDLLNVLGVAVWRQGRAAEAESIYRRACQIKSDDLRILTNLGLALYDQDRLVEASECYRRVIQIQPAAFDAIMNLGLVLSDQGKFDEAMDWLNRAYRLRPDSPHLLLILGMNLVRQGKIDEAINVYEKGVSLRPDFPQIRRNLGLALLCRGDYARGWPEHEWRLKCHDHQGRRINNPIWSGDEFPGGTILLHAEQGFGDTLQFIRFAPMVKARGGHVVVLCPTRLLGLVARCPGVDLAFDGSSFEPPHTTHAPLMSLPAILGTTLETLPAQVPYLAADPVLAEHWGAELTQRIRSRVGSPARPFLIGIAWQGSPTHRRDHWRSFPLVQFAPLAELPGVRLISLQTDHGLDQIVRLGDRLPIMELTGRHGRDFGETAAIMTHLDLVITADTAVAHLAGGLGVPVWVALSSVGEWRWLDGRDDSPWYPTMRLFRQTRFGDWDGVFQRMTDALRSKVGSRQRAVDSRSEEAVMAEIRNGLTECDAPPVTANGSGNARRTRSYLNEAIRLSRQGQLAEAESHLREALRLRPDDAEVLNELGLSVWRQGRAAEAEPFFRLARRTKPDDFQILSNLGLALYDQDRIDEASECYRRAIEIQPDAFDALMNLGLIHSDRGQFDHATDCLDAAYRLQPNSAGLLQIIGINLGRQGRWDQAIEKYERGLRLEPDFPRLHLNLAYALLCQGDYKRGWQEHEWRLKWRDHPVSRINRPFWDGDDFQGRTILLHSEQGLGDSLQFIRFAPLVKARGGYVLVCCPGRLLRIIARCEGVDLAFEGSSFKPDCHIHAPFLSLPAILGTTLDTLPNRVPYLATDPVLVEHWRVELARVLERESGTPAEIPSRSDSGRAARPFLIGVAWQGSPAHRLDRWRSFPLAQFAPIADLPGVRLVSLQADDGLDQVVEVAGRIPIIQLSGRRERDFADTAAIMTHLDLVITPDTAVAHLAGGLGLPVWVGLNSMGDWRWLAGRDDSPWYPTMKLFHQTTLGDWDGVFQRMTDALKSSAVGSRR